MHYNIKKRVQLIFEKYYRKLIPKNNFLVSDQCSRADEPTVVLTLEKGVKIAFESLYQFG